jgi:hypothetical protein
MFESTIYWMLNTFYLDAPPYINEEGLVMYLTEPGSVKQEDGPVFLYLIYLKHNYRNKNVIKLGFSNNVEAHLCSQLSEDFSAEDRCCFKIPMLRSEAISFKDMVRPRIAMYQIKTRRVFRGMRDWYYYQAHDMIIDKLPYGTDYQKIDWDLFRQEYKKREAFRKPSKVYTYVRSN